MLLFGHTGITLGAAWIAPSKHLPYAALLVGSLLPDLVDKLGYLVFRDLFTASRTIGHSLVFGLVLLLVGWLLHRRGPSGLLVLALASLGHLALDEMWQIPHTLFWPLLGWGFGRVEFEEWALSLLFRLGNIRVLVPELVGLGIILALAARGLLARWEKATPQRQ